MTTPENIETLGPNQVFVFGSNFAGRHIGGAARAALLKFGAINGRGEGLQGQSYAFPTLGYHMEKLQISDLEELRDKLFQCAKENPSFVFLVTRVGCGIAGFTDNEIAPLFKNAPKNITLPVGWKRG